MYDIFCFLINAIAMFFSSVYVCVLYTCRYIFSRILYLYKPTKCSVINALCVCVCVCVPLIIYFPYYIERKVIVSYNIIKLVSHSSKIICKNHVYQLFFAIKVSDVIISPFFST